MAIVNPTEFRKKICEKLIPILGEETLSINMEKGIFNYTIKEANSKKIIKKWDNPAFAMLYVDRLRSIYLNLKNEDLLNQIKNGELAPQSVAFMTHQELNPSHWTKLIEKKIKRDASKFNTGVQASTDMYTCKKCKSKKCTYYELQTRSADESTSVFVTCLDCGKNWRAQ